MARTPKTPADPNAPAKPKREQGPKKLYLILTEGSDKEGVRNSIAQVTFNGRKLLESMSASGDAVPFLIYKIEVDKRGGDEA